jgi:regulatory protein CII
VTKLRDPATIEGALQRCITHLGPQGIKAATGKSYRYALNWSDPDDPRQVSVALAVRLDAAMKAAGHSPPIHDAYADLLKTEAAGAGLTPMQAFLGVTAETGQLAQFIAAALEDGVISRAERSDIRDAAFNAIRRLRALILAIEEAAAV